MPKLNKDTIYSLLNRRFSGGFKKLADLPQPSLLKDAQKASVRVAQAIANKERIVIVGDYDVDGVTSTAIMLEFFKQLSYPVQAVIPNRFHDGYGVSVKIVERIEADLVITVDNGINALEAAQACKEKGIDLIITDHHTPSKVLPEAFAIINPKQHDCPYPFKEICGAQVAWLFIALIKQELKLNINMSSFLDLLTLAIIADIMPLIDVNRALVKQGLLAIQKSSRPCFIILREVLGKQRFGSEDVAFAIAPRLNSAGRMDDASTALAFLTAEDADEAFALYDELNNLNEMRKETEAINTQACIKQVYEEDSIIVVHGEGWHEGVVGIVAAKLVQHFGKPAIVLSLEDGIAKGSARSIGNIDIYELIAKQRPLLEKFGGHKMAAGLSLNIKNIEAFRQAINKDALRYEEKDFEPLSKPVGEIDIRDIGLELLSLLEQFEPYGEGNEKPKFIMNNATILSARKFGSNKDHVKLLIKAPECAYTTQEIIIFKTQDEFKSGEQISFTYGISKNEYNGRVSTQVILDRFIS